MKPKVTVLLPVYNGGSYLRAAIESILRQTFADFEFLIINDKSTDESASVIASFTDKRISSVINKENIGLLKTLNKGIELAQGEYIARMDQDDLSLPERLAKQVAFLDANPGVGVLGTGFQLIDGRDTYSNSVKFPDSPSRLRWLLIFQSPFAHPTVMMRTALAKRLGGYTSPQITGRGKYPSEDYELWRRMSKYTKLANLPSVELALRKHDENYTNLHFDEHLVDAHKISRLVVIDILGEVVDQRLVTMLWTKQFNNPKDAQAVADLLAKLYKAFMLKHRLRFVDRQWIAFDVVKRILDISLRVAREGQAAIIAQAAEINLFYTMALLPLLSLRNRMRKGQ